jgi:hypothetical protein
LVAIGVIGSWINHSCGRAAPDQSRPNPYGLADWGGIPDLEPYIFYAVLA